MDNGAITCFRHLRPAGKFSDYGALSYGESRDFHLGLLDPGVAAPDDGFRPRVLSALSSGIPRRIITSPLRRAVETGAAIAEIIGEETVPRQDDDLSEITFDLAEDLDAREYASGGVSLRRDAIVTRVCRERSVEIAARIGRILARARPGDVLVSHSFFMKFLDLYLRGACRDGVFPAEVAVRHVLPIGFGEPYLIRK